MSTQPEAIRLADALDRWHEGVFPVEAAAELRRLHAENEDLRRCAEVEEVEKYAAANRRLHALNGELLEALKLLHDATWLVSKGHYNEELHDIAVSKARAVIKKAEGV
jgi:hypothetical protein